MRFELWIAGSPWRRRFGWGFWCGDLLCVKPVLQGNRSHLEWENVREKYLTPMSHNVIWALFKWFWKLLIESNPTN